MHITQLFLLTLCWICDRIVVCLRNKFRKHMTRLHKQSERLICPRVNTNYNRIRSQDPGCRKALKMENKKTGGNTILERFFAASQQAPQYHPAFKSKLPAGEYRSKLVDLADADSGTGTEAVDFFHDLSNEETGETFCVRFRLYGADLVNFVNYMRDNNLGLEDIDNLIENILITHPETSNYAKIEHRKVICSEQNSPPHSTRRGLLGGRRSTPKTLPTHAKTPEFDDEFDDFFQEDCDD